MGGIYTSSLVNNPLLLVYHHETLHYFICSPRRWRPSVVVWFGHTSYVHKAVKESTTDLCMQNTRNGRMKISKSGSTTITSAHRLLTHILATTSLSSSSRTGTAQQHGPTTSTSRLKSLSRRCAIRPLIPGTNLGFASFCWSRVLLHRKDAKRSLSYSPRIDTSLTQTPQAPSRLRLARRRVRRSTATLSTRRPSLRLALWPKRPQVC